MPKPKAAQRAPTGSFGPLSWEIKNHSNKTVKTIKNKTINNIGIIYLILN
jgi:hypothetical protein